MKTYQDFAEVQNKPDELGQFILKVISDHKNSADYKTAAVADQYDRKLNPTIRQYQKLLYDITGRAVPDNYSANYKMASGFFPRFVTQQNQYLLGNGATLSKLANKEKLGKDFDTILQQAGRSALVEKVSFGFWNYDHLEMFRYQEFAPLWDEETGALRAGIRFWQLADDKPLRATLYELDGITEFIKRPDADIKVHVAKHSYQRIVTRSEAGGEEISDGGNYPGFPIIPLWANPHHQSEIVGIRESIDCYDLIKSGFANDIDDASMIYWTLQNAGGMDDIDLVKFVERMRTVKAAVVEGGDGVKAEAHTMDVPREARETILNRLKTDLYEDFQIVNVAELSSGAKTATEIKAAYQPMDNKVDQYEYCVLDFLAKLFVIVGIDDTATFQRSRIVNQTEETQMVLSAADYLDDEAILKHLPWLVPEEIEEIQKRKAAEDIDRLLTPQNEPPTEE